MVIFIKEKNHTRNSFKKKKNINKFGNVYKRKEKNRSTLRIFIKITTMVIFIKEKKAWVVLKKKKI